MYAGRVVGALLVWVPVELSLPDFTVPWVAARWVAVTGCWVLYPGFTVRLEVAEDVPVVDPGLAETAPVLISVLLDDAAAGEDDPPPPLHLVERVLGLSLLP